MAVERLGRTLELLREATSGTGYDGKLWLVGGYVRDKLLGAESAGDDVDIVLELDSSALAQYLSDCGITEHSPVTYPRFGTAMVSIGGVNVELVTARRESYTSGSRKPDQVEPATIEEDARRRDFTINSLIENLHTGELRDPLGVGISDIENKTIRTPLDPADTFADDPLRMLRAIRFAARFDFTIDGDTMSSITRKAPLLTPTVSGERIRDEFNKILMGRDPAEGLNLLNYSHLMEVFAPELAVMQGVLQNEFHEWPVWEHTVIALSRLVDRIPDAPLLLRLAVLLHDCGKPSTRTVGNDGRIHFYGHEDVGAGIARKFMQRLKYSHSDIETVSSLVAQHMRIGEYQPKEWTDAAVRRLIRAAGPFLDWLFAIHRADVAALGPQHRDISRAIELKKRIDALQGEADSVAMESPLTGSEIMEIVGLSSGPQIGQIKSALTDAVIEGRLGPADKELAARMARELHSRSV